MQIFLEPILSFEDSVVLAPHLIPIPMPIWMVLQLLWNTLIYRLRGIAPIPLGIRARPRFYLRGHLPRRRRGELRQLFPRRI
jgi:hypothetical protein